MSCAGKGSQKMPKPFVDRDGYGVSRQYKSISRWNKLPPLPVIPDSARTMPVTDGGLQEMIWHIHTCTCPWCLDSRAARTLKNWRAFELHLSPTLVGRKFPEDLHPPARFLRAVEKEEQSTQDHLCPGCTGESEWQPYDQAGRATLTRLAEQSQTADSTASEHECQGSPDAPSGSLS